MRLKKLSLLGTAIHKFVPQNKKASFVYQVKRDFLAYKVLGSRSGCREIFALIHKMVVEYARKM